jgi:hypothetical protein
MERQYGILQTITLLIPGQASRNADESPLGSIASFRSSANYFRSSLEADIVRAGWYVAKVPPQADMRRFKLA